MEIRSDLTPAALAGKLRRLFDLSAQDVYKRQV